jgi:hypothetical protein
VGNPIVFTGGDFIKGFLSPWSFRVFWIALGSSTTRLVKIFPFLKGEIRSFFKRVFLMWEIRSFLLEELLFRASFLYGVLGFLDCTGK